MSRLISDLRLRIDVPDPSALLGEVIDTMTMKMMRLFAAQKNVATMLQQHYMHALAEIAGLELAAAAESAYHRDLIGGEFHDVFRLPDGKRCSQSSVR